MAKIAVIILTFNEEKNIADAIRSAAFADEVLLIDSGSTDETLAIARALGARVVQHPMKGFADQRNFALRETAADWGFYLDADGRLTPAAGEAIRRLAEARERVAYEICRHNIVFGQPMHYGAHRPDWSLRLFPRDAVTWEGVVHERAVVSVSIRRMPGEILHYTYDTWSTYLTKFNRYTTLAAPRQCNDAAPSSPLYLFQDVCPEIGIFGWLFGFCHVRHGSALRVHEIFEAG